MKKDTAVSVRDLVDFVLRRGDLMSAFTLTDKSILRLYRFGPTLPIAPALPGRTTFRVLREQV